MKRIALLLVILLVFAFGAFKQQESPYVISCGTVSGGSSMTAKGAEWAEKFGTWVHNVAENPEQYRDPANVKKVVEGVLKDVIWFWLRAAYLGLQGKGMDPEILRLHDDAAKQAQQARDMCTPCPTATSPSPLASTGTDPAASLSASVAPGPFTPTGSPEEIARQAAARYWPADQVDTAVAVAHAESGFNVKARNNVQAGMLGLWQINLAAHRNLVGSKDWTDPSVNAWLAYQIWHDAGDSWTPWSTYTSGSYRKYLTDGAEATGRPTEVTGTAPGIGCQSGSMPAVNVATWNMYVHNPTGNVLEGMRALGKQADIIGTQENCDAGKKRAELAAMDDAFAISAGDTCHPIFYRKAKFTLVSESSVQVFKRTDDYEGPSQGDRYINTVTLRDANGKTITEVNFHQLPRIQKSGDLNVAWPKRIKAAKKIVQGAMDSARAHMSEGAVVVTADSNFDGDPDGMYAAAGLTSASSVFGDLKQATRTRDIDQILFSAGVPTSEKVIGAWHSDHSARVVTFPGDTTATSTDAGTSAPTPADFNFPGQNTPAQAVDWMQAHQGSSGWAGRCLAAVGRAYGNTSTQAVNGHYYAVGQLDAMPAKYVHRDGSNPPLGALVFWKTGSPAGHIAISNGDGTVWTTDPPGHRGSIGKVPITQIDAWGPRLAWTSPVFIGRTQTGPAA